MTSDIPQNVSAWIGEDERKRDTVREFDELASATKSGPYSRSDELWEAIRLRIVIERQLAKYDLGDLDEREKHGTVRQALLEYLDDEMGGE